MDNETDKMEILLRGMAGENPSDIIVEQEARGQQDFVNNTLLPKRLNYGTKEQFEQMGIVFGEDADDIFVQAELPKGWKKEPKEHSMWSALVDDQGRERALIFYKAAFYDRAAHLNISKRFSFHIDHNEQIRQGVVTDCEESIWKTEQIDINKEKIKSWDARDILEPKCLEWLGTHYPDWENPLAYWD